MQPARTAFITGAAQGIGAQTARALALEGYNLVLNDVKSPNETLEAVRACGANVIAALGDVSSESDVERMCDATLNAFGGIDALINNAGISFIQSAETTTLTQWQRVLEVNLTGPFLTSQIFGRLMLRAGSGAIVNVASVAGLLGIADRAAYNASKHGLVGLTRTLAAEWGGRGVRVNAVCPGWVKTEMDATDLGSGAYSDADIHGRVPMARFADPDDIAQAIAFLCNPQKSAFINGHALSVDGGWASDGSWESLRIRKQQR